MQHQNTDVHTFAHSFTISQKGCSCLSHFSPVKNISQINLLVSDVVTAVTGCFTIKNRQKLMKIAPLFIKRPPSDKHWSFLQKCQKCCATSKCVSIPYFVKVCTIPKNIFGQNMTLFLAVARVYTTTHFCSLRWLVDGKQLKNRPKMDEKWHLSPQEILPVKIDPFCKNIKSKGQRQHMC